MKLYGLTLFDVLAIARDAGWIVAMVLICVATSAAASLFVKGRWKPWTVLFRARSPLRR